MKQKTPLGNIAVGAMLLLAVIALMLDVISMETFISIMEALD